MGLDCDIISGNAHKNTFTLHQQGVNDFKTRFELCMRIFRYSVLSARGYFLFLFFFTFGRLQL